MWDPDESLQELHHRQGEGQLIRPLLHLRPGQVVLHHELGQVPHDLRGGGHLTGREVQGLTVCDQSLLLVQIQRVKRRANISLG